MKILAVMTFAAATALANVPAIAEGPTRGGPGNMGGPAAMLDQDDRAALADARIAAIRAGLRLTQEQEALFEPVAEAVRAMSQNAGPRHDQRGRAWDRQGEMREGMREGMQEMSRDERRALRAEMRERRGEGQSYDFMERLERRSAMASANAALMADLAQAMRPLWDALDADQKRLLPILMQPNMMMGQHRQMRYDHSRGGHMGAQDAERMRGRGARE